MGMVYAEITLKNVEDELMAKRGVMSEQEIRQTTVTALVDSGAWTMVINEDTREKLGLELRKDAQGRLADGTYTGYKLASPLEITWKNRSFICEPLVIPTTDENLLGAIPLEGMDLIVDPKNLKLIGAHGDVPVMRI